MPRYVDEATLQAREEDILDKALDIISNQGIVALTMDKLVSEVSYSKGTVYNHFTSKEDVLAGLCNRSMKRKAELFTRAISIEGTRREKMTAVSFSYMLSVLMAPQHFALVMNAKTEMFDKASEARQDEHKQVDSQLFEIICGVINEAIESKELVLHSTMDARQISFSIWAMSFGTIGLLLNGERACSTLTGMMLENRVIEHSNIVMDGLGWKAPKREQSDFIHYLKTDVFAPEMQCLTELGIIL